MNKIFNLTSTFKTLAEDDGSVQICGMASTCDFDRAGDSIDATAWTKGGLANFEKNPIILFNHDYNHPIGRATGLKVTENGLELKAKLSKNAKIPSGSVSDLVKDGVLGAFSVGFRVKDADYLSETDGLKINDAELFEVSVVSVPCNQAATFSLAKSFNSQEEYEDFKKTFINGVDLAGQSLAKDEDSLVASKTPEGDENVQKEIKMSEENKTPEIDLQAFAKQVAEETAAKIAMKQAEEKAAAEKAAEEAQAKAQAEAEAKAAQEAEVQSAIKVGVESGAERLLADVQAKLAEKDSKIEDVIASFQTQLQEKNEELTKMRESKAVFADRQEGANIKGNKGLMYAHLLGVMTQKGFDTDYARDVFEKAGIAYTGGGNAPDIAQEVSTQIEKEIELELRVANLFREMTVNAKSTVIPLQTDVNTATWSTGGEDANASKAAGGTGIANREATDDVAGTYNAKQKILTVDRLISTTYMDNYIDEEVLVNLMPMLTQGIARSHARAVDTAIINGNGAGITGLDAMAVQSDNGIAAGGLATVAVTAAQLVGMRRAMGVYGLMPQDVVYIVSQKVYHDLINDGEFDNIFEVGSDRALKLTGQVGAVYGSPVVISDNFVAPTATTVAGENAGAFAVNVSNFVMPRLRGVSIETDYEVAAQRRLIVGTQHLGFDELFDSTAGKAAAVKLDYV